MLQDVGAHNIIFRTFPTLFCGLEAICIQRRSIWQVTDCSPVQDVVLQAIDMLKLQHCFACRWHKSLAMHCEATTDTSYRDTCLKDAPHNWGWGNASIDKNFKINDQCQTGLREQKSILELELKQLRRVQVEQGDRSRDDLSVAQRCSYIPRSGE